ncbi:hypothetical protein KF840_19445 [bacterium]|nr:hypothetical protein [bacterium]
MKNEAVPEFVTVVIERIAVAGYVVWDAETNRSRLIAAPVFTRCSAADMIDAEGLARVTFFVDITIRVSIAAAVSEYLSVGRVASLG